MATNVLSPAIRNNKTKKSETVDWTGSILYMTPEKQSGLGNVCPFASKGCAKTCLYSAGRGVMAPVIKGRLRKTEMFFKDRLTFFRTLAEEIRTLQRKAKREGKRAFVRLNGTSDIRWENFNVFEVMQGGALAQNVFQAFPDVQFYDYTKDIKKALAVKNDPALKNYHVTFSRSEVNEAEVKTALDNGINVAVVFDKVLPKEYMGRPVINGDKTDMRFLEGYKGVIVGLIAKGKARYDDTGFVVRAA